MPAPRFFCVDDNARESNALIAQLNASRIVKIVADEPKQQEVEVQAVLSSGCDGIILDLRLDNNLTSEGFRAQYTSNALAQGIRDSITLKNLKDIPIVLWSSQSRLKDFYDVEQTGHDLYDAVIVKSEIQRDFKAIATRLKSLAQGYAVVNQCHQHGRRGFLEMLGLEADSKITLDLRIGSQYDDNGQVRKFPAHRFARYIMSELIEQPNPLVNEALLAARLGIDLTCTGWPALLKKLDSAKYRGVFGEGWVRWWWDLVSQYLQENAQLSTRVLRSMDAKSRMEALAAAFSIRGLREARPIASDYSSSFWAVCDGLREPLDPVDGFVSSWSSREAWHDRRYISLKAAAERKRYKDGLRVHPLDRERFEQIVRASKFAGKK